MRKQVVILFLLLIIAFLSKSQNNFRNHLASLKGIYVRDSISLTTMNIEKLPQIDSTILISNEIMFLQKENEYDIGSFKEADCRVLKYLEGKELDLLILVYYTSLAGDGNPLVLLSTLSKQGIIIDQEEIAIRYCHDPGYEPNQILIINSLYSVELITREIRRKQVEYDFIFESDNTKKTYYNIVDGLIKM